VQKKSGLRTGRRRAEGRVQEREEKDDAPLGSGSRERERVKREEEPS